MAGVEASLARHAELLRTAGQLSAAILALEAALAAHPEGQPWPGWLCGRLATVYRAAGRHADEVDLLTRYRETQTADDLRNRFDARLSKARVAASRMPTADSGALASIRSLTVRPRRRHKIASASCEDRPRLVVDAGGRTADDLDAIIAHGRARREPVESLMLRVKALYESGASESGPATLTYSAALVRLLAEYFATEATDGPDAPAAQR